MSKQTPFARETARVSIYYVTDISVASMVENYTPRAELIFYFHKQYNRSPHYSATN